MVEGRGLMNVLRCLLALSLTLVRADKLDEALASAIFPPRSSQCQESSGTTSFSHVYSSTDGTSDWDVNTVAYEENVFEVDISHTDADPDRSWTIRIGKGGQISSFIVAAGESMSNQASQYAIWNDLVQQMVAVNGDLNAPDAPNFIHQAGPYARDTGMPPPFYSPNLALDCSEDYCATINWGQQAHLPTTFDSPLLYYTRYRNCGDGIIEYDMAMHHFGLDDTDQYTFFNTPWTGVRTSTFRDMMVANTAGVLEHEFPMGSFGPYLRDLDQTGGFTTFAEDLELPSTDFEFYFCVNKAATTTTADIDCNSNSVDPADIVPFTLEVFENATVEITGHHAALGLDTYTVAMKLCNLTAPIIQGRSGWGNPFDGVLLTNDRSGFTFESDYLIHPCWEGDTTYFSSNVTKDVLNEEFIVGDTISIKYNPSGKPVNSQLALTFVHGTNPEYPQSWYRAKSRIRYGTTNNRRDGTVWTTNWLGKLNPTETYFSRKYMISDRLDQMETVAATLSPETDENVDEINELNAGETITLWKNNFYFGASIGSETCFRNETGSRDTLATVACTGSSTPKDGFQPWFYITCGQDRATTMNPYNFSLFDGDDKKPYLCDETDSSVRATWKLLGFFDSDCYSIDNLEYFPDFCESGAVEPRWDYCALIGTNTTRRGLLGGLSTR